MNACNRFDGLTGLLDESTEFCEDVIVWDKGDMRMLALPVPDNKGFELFLRVGFGLSEEQVAKWPEEHGIETLHEDITKGRFQYDVTPQQAAKRLGISYAMVCKMLRDGVIKGTKVSGKWRISSQEVKRFAFKQRKHR